MRDTVPSLQTDVVAIRDVHNPQWHAQKLQQQYSVMQWLSPTDFPKFKRWLQGSDNTLFRMFGIIIGLICPLLLVLVVTLAVHCGNISVSTLANIHASPVSPPPTRNLSVSTLAYIHASPVTDSGIGASSIV